MKKLLIIPIIFLTSCVNQQDVDKLNKEYHELKTQIWESRDSLSTIEEKLKVAQDKLYATNAKIDGTKVKYIITFKLRQSHVTFDIDEHLKDMLNEITFDMPVDEDYYNKVKVGDDIVDDFRMGSLIMYGSFGSWDMSVDDKKVVVY